MDTRFTKRNPDNAGSSDDEKNCETTMLETQMGLLNEQKLHNEQQSERFEQLER